MTALCDPPRSAPSRAVPSALAAGATSACRRARTGIGLFGPAFVAAVAYVDPGNFATNVQAGARFGYLLLWVIVLANLIALFVQYQSAKVGLATGCSLPELCRENFPRTVTLLLWVQAELVAIATDLAEFVGAALGLHLLFGVPMLPAGGITAIVAFVVLSLDRRGHRRFELVVAALLGLVALGFAYDLAVVGRVSVADAGAGLIPRVAGPDSVTLVIGIVGATVMPHVIYLHSALTGRRDTAAAAEPPRRALRYLRLDCALALGLSGIVNLAMLVLAAALFHGTGRGGVDSIQAAHAGLTALVGGAAGIGFAVALLASGLSSSSVGTYAGQVVMAGFTHRRIPLYLRRGITAVPALAILASGLPTTTVLVLSQVVLSFGIPFAIVPLLLVARRRDLMGRLVNRRCTTVAMVLTAAVVVALNACLIVSAL